MKKKTVLKIVLSFIGLCIVIGIGCAIIGISKFFPTLNNSGMIKGGLGLVAVGLFIFWKVSGYINETGEYSNSVNSKQMEKEKTGFNRMSFLLLMGVLFFCVGLASFLYFDFDPSNATDQANPHKSLVMGVACMAIGIGLLFYRKNILKKKQEDE